MVHMKVVGGWDGVVGWTVWGSNPGGVKIFHGFQTSPKAHPAPCTLGTGYFLGVEELWRGADHPPPSGTEFASGLEEYAHLPCVCA